MKIPRQDMPVQEPEDRVQNFDEVALGFTLDLARKEAERCLQCKEPHCMEGCPVEVTIPEFIEAVRVGDMAKAVEIMKSKNNLPAICGRVCPQEVQCEARCILARRGNRSPSDASSVLLGISSSQTKHLRFPKDLRPARKSR